MTATKWWCTPLSIEDHGQLTHRLDQQFPITEPFANADPLTVRLRGIMVGQGYDLIHWQPRASNDLMVMTSSQFGSEPPVERLHYMQDNVPLGWQADFFNEIVLALQAYNSAKRQLTLRVQVYDLDQYDTDLLQQIAGASQSVAVAFPPLAVYAAAISFGSGALLNLVDSIDKHDRILDERIILEQATPGTGHKLLQPGYYVCFSEPVPTDMAICLDSQLNVHVQSDNSETAPLECSYAVLSIEKDFWESRAWEIDQKVAKLVAELDGKGQSGRAAIDFLRETLGAYDQFKRLKHGRELMRKEALTDAERALLDRYRADDDLAPYLEALQVP